jgi:predicted RNA-binding protein YlqC (UPF0109 family)
MPEIMGQWNMRHPCLSVFWVRRLNFDTELTVRVWVPSKSIGKLIGVSGRTARALRILLRAMSATAGVGIALDIVAEG